MPASDDAILRDRLAAITEQAGAIALDALKGPLKHWTKSGSSPVSEADLAVNTFLAAQLPPLVPDAAWLSEETEDDLSRTGAATVWVVDPIDGTRAFIDGRPDWCIAAALVRDGRPVVAALHAPATAETFAAAHGAGATHNGTRLNVATGDTLTGARIAGPRGMLKALGEISPQIAPQPKIYSLALRLGRVAQGAIDAALASVNAYDWDLAAADLLVHEAGGLLTDFSGQKLRYNQPKPVHGALVAASPGRHAALMQIVSTRRNAFA